MSWCKDGTKQARLSTFTSFSISHDELGNSTLPGYNIEEKKLKSILKLCSKVARLLVSLAKNREDYDSSRVFLQAALHQLKDSQDNKSYGVSEDVKQ